MRVGSAPLPRTHRRPAEAALPAAPAADQPPRSCPRHTPDEAPSGFRGADVKSLQRRRGPRFSPLPVGPAHAPSPRAPPTPLAAEGAPGSSPPPCSVAMTVTTLRSDLVHTKCFTTLATTERAWSS